MESAVSKKEALEAALNDAESTAEERAAEVASLGVHLSSAQAETTFLTTELGHRIAEIEKLRGEVSVALAEKNEVVRAAEETRTRLADEAVEADKTRVRLTDELEEATTAAAESEEALGKATKELEAVGAKVPELEALVAELKEAAEEHEQATKDADEAAEKMEDEMEGLRDQIEAKVAELAKVIEDGEPAKEMERMAAKIAEDEAVKRTAEAAAAMEQLKVMSRTADAAADKATGLAAELEALRRRTDRYELLLGQRDDVGNFLLRLGLDITDGDSDPTATVQESVWALVEDWLRCLDFQHTADCLVSERGCVRYSPFFGGPIAPAARERSERSKEAILRAFDDGNAPAFESLWQTHVPPSVLAESPHDTEAERAQRTGLQRLLVQINAHFALLPLRRRLSLMAPREASAMALAMERAEAASPSKRPAGGDGTAHAFIDEDGKEPTLYPSGPDEEAALQRFQNYLAGAAAQNDDLLNSYPELLPLFALPQLPRPWTHPALTLILQPPPPSDGVGYSTDIVTDVKADLNATLGSISAGLESSPWVSNVRAELAELLESRLLLARPPALLILHRAYTTWQTLLADTALEARAQSNELVDVTRDLFGLSMQLMGDLSQSNAGTADKSALVKYRRNLNNARQRLEPLVAALRAGSTTSSDVLDAKSKATRDYETVQRALQRLVVAPVQSGDGAGGDGDGGALWVESASSGALKLGPVLEAAVLQWLPPPLDISKLKASLLYFACAPPTTLAVGPAGAAEGDSLVTLGQLLRGVGDRLSSFSPHVRDQAAEECLTGTSFVSNQA